MKWISLSRIEAENIIRKGFDRVTPSNEDAVYSFLLERYLGITPEEVNDKTYEENEGVLKVINQAIDNAKKW